MNTPELVGDIGFVPKDYDNLFLPDRLWLAKFKDNAPINVRWLSYKFTSPQFRHNIKSIATGTSGSMKNISQKSFLSLPIAVPPKSEQDKTVEFISVWDKAIAKVEEIITSKKRYKKGLMQQLLSGKKRFPEFEDEPWIEVKLGEIFNERKEKDCTHLDLVAITTDNGVIDRDELDRKDTSSSNKDNYKRIAPGDIGYNTMRMWQGVSGYSELEGIVSPAYTIVSPIEDKVDGRFMSYLFKYPPIIDLFRRYSQGLVSDTLNLKYDNFAQIKVTIPQSLKEQKKIRNTLLAADQEIELLKEKLEAFKKQKKGLMQKLLTGKVRVGKELTKAESYG
jgi:type I restriction enzyme S subunit